MVIQGKARRFGLAVLFALVVAFVLVAVKSSEAQMLPSGCKDLTPSDPMWWMRQCYIYPAFEPLVLVRIR